MHCVLERGKLRSYRHTKMWVYTPLPQSLLTFDTDKKHGCTTTQSHISYIYCRLKYNSVKYSCAWLCWSTLVPGYPIPYFTKNVDRQLPWDFTANPKVSRPEVFQTKEKRKKRSSPNLRTFIQDIFPQASIFHTKDNLNMGSLAGFSCNHKEKAEIGEQISATQEPYASTLK